MDLEHVPQNDDEWREWWLVFARHHNLVIVEDRSANTTDMRRCGDGDEPSYTRTGDTA